MRDQLLHIMSNYQAEKLRPLKDNILAKYIRDTTAKDIASYINRGDKQYVVTGSSGIGNWPLIPWIGVFDPDITTTATKGYDIVYLFKSDMSGVYLSLNQGWTYYKDKYGIKNGKLNISYVSECWRDILSSALGDFLLPKIKLAPKDESNKLYIGYELGHICGKFYPFADMPSESVLQSDLQNLLGVYRELKGKLIELSVEKTNNNLLVGYKLGLTDTNRADAESEFLDSIIDDAAAISTLVEEAAPKCCFSDEDDTLDFSPKKTDFIAKAKKQKKIGYAGEVAVLAHERTTLINAGKEDLSKRVQHISIEKGDGAGYDILSYYPDGRKKYIEVKTTTGAINTPFQISSTELAFSEKNDENYVIYRLFGFSKSNQIKFYKIEGYAEKTLKLRPKQFLAYPI